LRRRGDWANKKKAHKRPPNVGKQGLGFKGEEREAQAGHRGSLGLGDKGQLSPHGGGGGQMLERKGLHPVRTNPQVGRDWGVGKSGNTGGDGSAKGAKSTSNGPESRGTAQPKKKRNWWP